MKKCRFTHRP